AYGGAELECGAVRNAHERWKALEQRDGELRAQQDEVLRKADYLRHVVGEIGAAAPRVGEDEALAAQARRLAHAEELGRLARELEQALDTAGLGRAGDGRPGGTRARAPRYGGLGPPQACGGTGPSAGRHRARVRRPHRKAHRRRGTPRRRGERATPGARYAGWEALGLPARAPDAHRVRC